MSPFFLLCLLVFPVASFGDGRLKVGFYDSTCPNAESIVQRVVRKRFAADRSVTAALLRMHFHDCFVRGCDASILIDPTKDKPSEKFAGPNGSIREFKLIDKAKQLLESSCPSTVSCADVIAIATRDAVHLAGGPRYNIPTGRRDGLISDPSLVDLPSPSFTVSQALDAFTAKGFNLTEMVTLLGGHTVGKAHCGLFLDRISSPPDPTMSPALASKLGKICGTPSGSLGPAAFLDQNTSFVVDNQYYNMIMEKKGILKIDQELGLDSRSSRLVASFAGDENGFRTSFAAAMVKLGSVDVITGEEGEVRTNCRVFNNPN
ncbi:hypothetical protein MLD38_030957 [Melastoma candidum]|uniref:Uncharacterized protein n=1 Tax=Melastoma candidum TaxID=119954 RepID=A0ACB9MMQ0_9MYRT|nr:hypothetical protein MLD38_030957 [Melastoma candidum]